MKLIFNIAAFQVGWFSCVLGAAHQLPWVGLVMVALIVVAHLWLSSSPAREILLILACGLLGLVVDSGFVMARLVTYPSGVFAQGLAPYWLVGMWMLLATTLNVSLRWLHGRYFVAAALGLISGPLSYIGGERLGGIIFLQRELAVVGLAIAWAMLLPALIGMARWSDEMPVPNPRRI